MSRRRHHHRRRHVRRRKNPGELLWVGLLALGGVAAYAFYKYQQNQAALASGSTTTTLSTTSSAANAVPGIGQGVTGASNVLQQLLGNNLSNSGI